MRRAIIVALLVLCGAHPAAAERLFVSLSNHRVPVTSNFAGEDLVLFGSIEPGSGKTILSSYDLVVTVTGPRETYRTRRKARLLGIWVNVDSREFVRVPSYLAILSNRRFSQIANEETLRRLQVGLDNFLLPQRIGPDIADTVREDPFRTRLCATGKRAGPLPGIGRGGDISQSLCIPGLHPFARRRTHRQLCH